LLGRHNRHFNWQERDGNKPWSLLADMSDTSNILAAIQRGEPQAAEQLLPLVYEELRKLAAAQLAREKPGQTLQATALVHEAWLRLVGPQTNGKLHAPTSPQGADAPRSPAWNSRGHFFGAAAEAMRRILVDAARRRQSEKRGGNLIRQDIDELDVPLKQPPEEVLSVHEALDRLVSIDSRAAELVKLRYFGGFTLKEAAEILEIAPRTADDVWAYARAWLAAEIQTE
jgi:RNA polymerase sigma factor (sigma-70 family)